MTYKYILDKSSKKFECPGCGKKTFVRYIDTETGHYIEYNHGRCDRESSCGYHHSKKGTATLVNFNQPYTKPVPPSCHPHDLIAKSGRNFKENNFVQFLRTIFTDQEVKHAILQYLIGTSKHWKGATVFWQIDEANKVRAGKILLYVTATGKRSKTADGKGMITWVHRAIKLKDYNLKQCLFGLHLINETCSKSVALVEGEKTAIIMSLFKPEYTWMATGSKQGFKNEMLQPIKQFRIVAFPDKSEYSDWNMKAQELNKMGYNISVNDWIENTSYDNGTDMADIYIAEKASTPRIDHNDLSQFERDVYRMEKANPALRLLISAFDLTDEYAQEIRKIG